MIKRLIWAHYYSAESRSLLAFKQAIHQCHVSILPDGAFVSLIRGRQENKDSQSLCKTHKEAELSFFNLKLVHNNND